MDSAPYFWLLIVYTVAVAVIVRCFVYFLKGSIYFYFWLLKTLMNNLCLIKWNF